MKRRTARYLSQSLILGTIIVLLGAQSANAGLRSIELFLGAPSNLSTNLTIEQAGQPPIDFAAKYDSNPFKTPFYYAGRFVLGIMDIRWEIQFIHQKVYLSNPPPEVQHFEISHGLNMLTLNYATMSLPVTLRVGAGIVLAHTESTVRGKSYSGGDGIFGTEYHLTGPVFMAGVGKDLEISKRLILIPEVALAAARAAVPVAEGNAKTWNVAFHGLLGIGYRF